VGWVGYYLLTKHSDWKTCKSETYDYEFSYPSNLEITSNTYAIGIGFDGEPPSDEAGCEKPVVFIGDLILGVEENLLQEPQNPPEYSNNGWRLKKEFSFNGINVSWFETTCDGMGSCELDYYGPWITFFKNGTSFILYKEGGQSILSDEIIEDIIRSFKFN
jgi:hypothetical protein